MMGIYRIRNVNDGYCYVGSAVNIERRWRWHQHYLDSGKHPTKKLQEAWSEHGSDAFTFEIIEEVTDRKELLTREAEAMGQHRLLYNWTVMDADLMRTREVKRRADSERHERRRALIRMLAKRVPDERVWVVSCLDCGGLHQLEPDFWEPTIRMISRESVEELKAQYVEKRLHRKGLQPEDVLFGAFE